MDEDKEEEEEEEEVVGRARQAPARGGGPGVRSSNEIRATIIDHVVNHGLSMREAGLRVQPNLSRHTVASIVRTFRIF